MDDIKQVIVIRKDLNMRKGKMCAQAAHSSMKVFFDRGETLLTNEGDPERPDYQLVVPLTLAMAAWVTGIFKKVVVGCSSEEELLDIYQAAQVAGLPCALVVDSGLTEFHGVKTPTCVAIGPAKSEDIDAITEGLPLL